MAVQQNKGTPARRGARRSHDALTKAALSEDPTTGETHRRHHVHVNEHDGSFYYRGKKLNPDGE